MRYTAKNRKCASRYRIRARRPWFSDKIFKSFSRVECIGQVVLEAHRCSLTVPQYNMGELWQVALLIGKQLAVQGKLEDVLWVWRPL